MMAWVCFIYGVCVGGKEQLNVNQNHMQNELPTLFHIYPMKLPGLALYSKNYWLLGLLRFNSQ